MAAEKKNLFNRWTIGVYVSITLLFLTLTMFVPEIPALTRIDWWAWCVVFLIVYTLLSLEKVGPTEQGTLVVFGDPVKNVSSGLVFRAWLIMEVVKNTRNKILIEMGTPEKNRDGEIVKRENNLKKGAKTVFIQEPLRITTDDGERDSKGEFKNKDPLGQRVTIDPHLFFIFQIVDNSRFIQEVGNPEDAARYAYEALKGTLQEYNGKYTPKEMLSKIKELNRRVRKAIERLVGDNEAWTRYNNALQNKYEPNITEEEKEDDRTKPGNPWGIDLQTVLVSSLGLSHDINDSMSKNVAAGFQQQARITLAEADRIERQKKGEGDGAAEKARLEGVAAGRLALSSAAGGKRKYGVLISQQETARQALGENSKIVVTNSKLLGEIAGGVAAIKETSIDKE